RFVAAAAAVDRAGAREVAVDLPDAVAGPVQRAVHGERVAGADLAAAATEAELERRARVDGERADEMTFVGEREQAGAELADATGAGDRGAKVEGIGAVEFQRAVVDDLAGLDDAAERTGGVAVAEAQRRAVLDRGGAEETVAVRGENQPARAADIK